MRTCPSDKAVEPERGFKKPENRLQAVAPQKDCLLLSRLTKKETLTVHVKLDANLERYSRQLDMFRHHIHCKQALTSSCNRMYRTTARQAQVWPRGSAKAAHSRAVLTLSGLMRQSASLPTQKFSARQRGMEILSDKR